MPVFYINAGKRYRVSSELAITQLIHFLNQQNLRQEHHAAAFEERAREARAWRQNLRELEAPPIDGTIRMPFLAARLRHHVPPQTTYVLEAVTNAAGLVDHLGLVEVRFSGVRNELKLHRGRVGDKPWRRRAHSTLFLSPVPLNKLLYLISFALR